MEWQELLAGSGYSLQSIDPNGTASSSHAPSTTIPTVKVVSSGPAVAAIVVSGIQVGAATDSWSLTLVAGARGFELNTTGSVDTSGGATVFHSLYATPPSVYGFYPADGVVQMMNAVSPVQCSFLNRILHSRLLSDPTPDRKRACDQLHASRESTTLTVANIYSICRNIEGHFDDQQPHVRTSLHDWWGQPKVRSTTFC
jgi:hypothetical protein